MACAAARNLDSPVEHCPDWTVRDLVVHIAGVQWFWADVVSRRVQDGAALVRPEPLADGMDPIAWFRAQTRRLHEELQRASDHERVWTWWPPDQSVAFVLRRQVNEVVIHGFDAANATGADTTIEEDAAVLGLEEFAEVMATELREGAAVDNPIELCPTDAPWRGRIFDKMAPGAAVQFSASAQDILLTLWGRAAAPDPQIAAALAAIDLT